MGRHDEALQVTKRAVELREDLVKRHPDRHLPDLAGFAIGVLERWTILTLVLVGQWSAIGLVLAAKSLARFEDLKRDRTFAEQYLVGTLASVLIAIASGLAVAAGPVTRQQPSSQPPPGACLR